MNDYLYISDSPEFAAFLSQIFISYTRKSELDKSKAKMLADLLESRGLDVWWDQDILPGQTFDEVIQAALEKCECALVLWSTKSIESIWVKDEATEANSRGILIPVMIEKIKIPLGFGRVHAADLSDWEGDPQHRELNSLITAIQAKLEKQKPLANESNESTLKKNDTSAKEAASPAEVISSPKVRETSNPPPQQKMKGDKPKSNSAGNPWKAELLSKEKRNIKFKVTLNEHEFLVEHYEGPWTIGMMVDGVVVSAGLGLDPNYDFTLKIKGKEFPFRFEAKNVWLGSGFTKFRLKAGNKVLYSEGNWTE